MSLSISLERNLVNVEAVLLQLTAE